MKAKNLLSIAISVLLSIAVAGCNQNKSEKQTDPKVKQLKEDMKEAGESIEAFVVAEKNEALKKGEEVIANFEKQIKDYEAKLKAQGSKVEAEAQQALDQLKKEQKKLQNDLDELQSVTADKWEEMKADIEKDMKEFNSRVKEVFNSDE